MNRGRRREEIFFSDTDREEFLIDNYSSVSSVIKRAKKRIERSRCLQKKLRILVSNVN